MIKLTEASGENGKLKTAIWVPLDIMIRDHDQGMALIKVLNNPGLIVVKESAEEVANKVLEYKLAMARYGHAVKTAYETESVSALDVAMSIEDQINRLAGLDDTQ